MKSATHQLIASPRDRVEAARQPKQPAVLVMHAHLVRLVKIDSRVSGHGCDRRRQPHFRAVLLVRPAAPPRTPATPPRARPASSSRPPPRLLVRPPRLLVRPPCLVAFGGRAGQRSRLTAQATTLPRCLLVRPQRLDVRQPRLLVRPPRLVVRTPRLVPRPPRLVHRLPRRDAFGGVGNGHGFTSPQTWSTLDHSPSVCLPSCIGSSTVPSASTTTKWWLFDGCCTIAQWTGANGTVRSWPHAA